ncbi:sugar transferase [Paraclostridium sordellii]|uniref:sugar transferase n=1 Tax=Paraclostridium sordellii TaxID=1505 RepID=UPI0005E78935|nr:sugar transferase [Paeniclostridium sordellii]CEN21625.1 sugar transferase [[Clostridium] sordellii] [Paeniclostridium sordellii]CEP97212.1 sugar transferase [[Clostridium] sordellii] [Paeniclostridium sordellii]
MEKVKSLPSKLSWGKIFAKRLFDITVSFIGLIFTLPIIIVAAILVRFRYKESGFFTQIRIGKDGKEFRIIKIKTMSSSVEFNTTVTTKNDPRITGLGKIFRKMKIDELPQLLNVLKGDMSFVGPRPDVKELVYSIPEEVREVFLSVRPGITGPATIKYRNEEEILASVEDPKLYNDEVIFPDKVNINLEYIREYGFLKDINYILKTVFK